MPLPSEEEVLSWIDALSNWGRWGADDELGTLNLVTPDVRKRAAATVRAGISVSCGRDAPAPGDPFVHPRAEDAFAHEVTAVPIAAGMRLGYALERITAMHVHGHAWTHLDALCHVFWDGHMYNGRPAGMVSAERGAEALPITVAKQGVVTRGVLLDVAAARRVAWLEPGDTVLPADLEAAERNQDVRVEPGDAVLLRTGYGRFRRERPDLVPADRIVEPGWHAAAMPWLHARDVALIGSDAANDAQPSPYPGVGLPIHVIGLVAMGLWLIDNCDLEVLAETAARLNRWSFHLSVCPLPLTGLTSSPVNPIATF